jgi:predicted ATPase
MDYIKIEGYKSIKSDRIDFLPINILIGANGSGKSNFLTFFEFLNKLTNRFLGDYIASKGGANKILHKGIEVTNVIFLKVEFDNGNNGYSATLELGEEGFVFTDEQLIYRRGKGIDISHSDTESRLTKQIITEQGM